MLSNTIPPRAQGLDHPESRVFDARAPPARSEPPHRRLNGSGGYPRVWTAPLATLCRIQMRLTDCCAYILCLDRRDRWTSTSNWSTQNCMRKSSTKAARQTNRSRTRNRKSLAQNLRNHCIQTVFSSIVSWKRLHLMIRRWRAKFKLRNMKGKCQPKKSSSHTRPKRHLNDS